MAFLLVLTAVEVLLLLLCTPFPVRVVAFVDLVSVRGAARAEIAGARAVSVVAKAAKDAFRMRINGKKSRAYAVVGKPSAAGILAAVRKAEDLGVLKCGRVSYAVGGEDAAEGAMTWGCVAALFSLLPPRIAKRGTFRCGESVFYVECELRLALSVFAALSALAAYLKAAGK